MVYVGVDLHRKRSHVVALDPTGEVVLSRRIGNAPAEFLRIFGELEPQPIEVVFEATYGWSWFADLLADAGIPAHMAHPLATKAISAARVTNDAVDAKTLAQLLRTNLLAEAWIAPPDARAAAGWSAPALGWSGCGHGGNRSCTRCWPTWVSSPS
jgi:transposase